MKVSKDIIKPMRWRYLLNLWSVVLFIVIIWDFVTSNALADIVAPTAAIYTALLAIFSAEKEFDRWYESFSGRHFGEIYVVIWTALLLVLMGFDAYFHLPYKLPSEVVATFIAVLAILAITRRSKYIHTEKRLK